MFIFSLGTEVVSGDSVVRLFIMKVVIISLINLNGKLLLVKSCLSLSHSLRKSKLFDEFFPCSAWTIKQLSNSALNLILLKLRRF